MKLVPSALITNRELLQTMSRGQTMPSDWAPYKYRFFHFCVLGRLIVIDCKPESAYYQYIGAWPLNRLLGICGCYPSDASSR